MATTKKNNPREDPAVKTHQIPPSRAAVRFKEEPLDAQPANKPLIRKQAAAAAAAAASPVKMEPLSTAATCRPVKTEPCTIAASAIEVSCAVASPSPSRASTAAARASVGGNAPQEPVVLKAMADLHCLSSALSTFNLCFDELQLHLESIEESIAKKLDELATDTPQKNANLAQEQQAGSPAAAPAEVPAEAPDGKQEPLVACTDAQPAESSGKQELQAVSMDAQPAESSGKQELLAASMDAQPAKSSAPRLGGPAEPLHPLEVICRTMDGKRLRKYVATHLKRIPMLRGEIPDALLEFAPDPALLTLNSLCRFFLQGSKAYAEKNSKMVTLRRAAIRILEFFILADCPKAEDAKAEAEASAVLWRSRLFREGGVACACYEDAVGLVLFLAAYRLASLFEIDDLGKLVDLSMIWKKVAALRRSARIREFIQDTIERMIKNDMHVQAITLLFRFDLRDKFDPESLLSSFLSKTEKSENIMKEEAQGSPEALREGCMRTLSALQLVVQCANEFRYKSEELSNYKIDDKIATLEKDIVNFSSKSAAEKTSHKRKAKELGSSENIGQQSVKRNQPTAAAFPVPPTGSSENTKQQSIKHTQRSTAAFPVPPAGSSESTSQQSVNYNHLMTEVFPLLPTGSSENKRQQSVKHNQPTTTAFPLPPLGSSENTRQQSVKHNQPSTAEFPVPSVGSSEHTRQQSVKHNRSTTAAFPVPAMEFSENTRQQSVKHNQPTTAAFPLPPTNAVVPSIQQTLHNEPTTGAFQIPPTIFVSPNFPGLLDGYSAASVKPAGFLPDGNAMGLETGNPLGPFGPIGTDISPPAVSGIGPYPVVGNLSSLGNSSRLSTDGATMAYGWKREMAFNSPSNRQRLLGGFPPSSPPGQSLSQPLTSTIPRFFGQLHRDTGPNLYGFADMVLDGKSYQDSASHL